MNDDPYIDRRSGVLRNLAGLTTQQALDDYESEKTRIRLAQLIVKLLPGKFDLDHLQHFHKHIFQDVYSFAGELRTINTLKLDSEGRGASHFADFRSLRDEAKKVFDELAKDNFLQGLSRSGFIEKGAKLLADINHLHCFREGNGRVQKAFLEDLAQNAGHSLDFSLVSQFRMIEACIAAERGEYSRMRHMFDDISDPSKCLQLRKAIEFFESQNFNWNNRDLACTQSGTSYSGTFVVIQVTTCSFTMGSTAY